MIPPTASGLDNRFEDALLALDRVAAKRLLDEAAGRLTPVGAIEALVVPALGRIGASWESGELALSQIYMSGRICEDLVDAFLPPGSQDRQDLPRMAIAVLEDFHVLGKRLVYATLRASGYDLVDYGSGIGADELASRCAGDGIEILLISTLMLPAALRIGAVRTELERLGCRAKIVVGGAPFVLDHRLAAEVGADAFGKSASEAVSLVRRFVPPQRERA